MSLYRIPQELLDESIHDVINNNASYGTISGKNGTKFSNVGTGIYKVRLHNIKNAQKNCKTPEEKEIARQKQLNFIRDSIRSVKNGGFGYIE